MLRIVFPFLLVSICVQVVVCTTHGLLRLLHPTLPQNIRPGYANEGNPTPPNAIIGSPSQPTTIVSGDLSNPCELSVTTVSVPGFVCKGQLIFEDNFNTDLSDDEIWISEIKFPGGPDFPFNMYMHGDNLKVKEGKLIIKPTLFTTTYGDESMWQPLDLSEGCTGILGTSECKRTPAGPLIIPPIITRKVTTRKSFSFKYGRVEIRAKMPKGDWILPEIQLEPLDSVYGVENYASGLIRVASVKGNGDSSKILLGGPIMSESNPYRSANLKQYIGKEPWSKNFHNYTLVWTKESITVSVDGVEYGQVKPPSEGFLSEAIENKVEAATRWGKGTTMAPFDEMFYISLGMNVGGVNEFPDSINKPWKNNSPKAMINFWDKRGSWYPTWKDDSKSLEVDYVKVYAL